MDASDYYVLRDNPCKKCHGTGRTQIDANGHWGLQHRVCDCLADWPGNKVPLIDALRALGIDVPELEEAPPAMCPP